MGNTIPHATTATNTNATQTNPTTSYISKAFPHFIIEHTFPPGSGRVFRSYRIRCPTVGSSSLTSASAAAAAASTTVSGAGSPLLICKAMVLRHPESKSDEIYAELSRKAHELEKIKDICQDIPNVLSYQKWSLSNAVLDHRTNMVNQPIFLFRQHLYSTLSDRLTMRPFLTNIEKTWIAYQILRALSSLHEHNIYHGNLTAENICITSWGWVCIVDIGGEAGMKPVKMKDYDPSDYTYYFKKGEGGNQTDKKNLGNQGDGGNNKNAGCYLAPERFYKRGEEEKQGKENEGLTAEMDVFAAGCVIIEMYLNGEKALDLGDLMEYRSKNTLVPSLKQKLNKIESSNIRAACKHMLSLDPSTRLSAKEYLDKLSSGKKRAIPACFEGFLWPFLKQFQNNNSDHQCWSHDAKVALLAKEYGKGTLRCLMEKGDLAGEKYFRDVIGPTIFSDDEKYSKTSTECKDDDQPLNEVLNDDLLAETEALLAKLETRNFELFLPVSSTDEGCVSQPEANLPTSKSSTIPVPSSPQSLIIILQLLLSSLRHVHRPSAKLLSLQLLLHLNHHINDDTRLQRILPNVISLLDDTQSIIRAQSLRVLTKVLECIESFPPSDAQLFPQYVMKRIQHLAVSTEDEGVRVAFAECLGRLAVTGKRFLDISHAMRLQDALDGSGGASKKREMKENTNGNNTSSSITRTSSIPEFPDDVAQLLGSPTLKIIESTAVNKPKSTPTQSFDATSNIPSVVDSNINSNTTLIPNTYDDELKNIQDSFTSYITQLTTTSSSHIKRALLFSSLPQLASLFGEEGATTRLLPTILTFWNDLDDWEVRAALCQSLPSICHVIGRVGTEEFVLPCIEVACLDKEEGVVGWAIWCLGALVEEGLVRGRAVLLGDMENREGRIGVLEKYGPLLIHPSGFIRHGTVSLFCAACRAIGFPDDEVFVLPILRPFLKYEPSRQQLQTKEDLNHCLLPPVSRRSLSIFIQKLRMERNDTENTTEGEITDSTVLGDMFHSISIDDSNNNVNLRHAKWDVNPVDGRMISAEGNSGNKNQSELSSFQIAKNMKYDVVSDEEMRLVSMKNYLDMVQQRNNNANNISVGGKGKENATQPENNILLSEAYSFAVPNQKFVEVLSNKTLPEWYEHVRLAARANQNLASESSSLKSLKSLMEVYGLSVTLPSNPSQPIRKTRGDFSLHESVFVDENGELLSHDQIYSLLSSFESKIFDAARKGEFGATATLDPCFHDASIIGIKMHCLGVPSLPPQLGVLRETDGRAFSWHGPILSSSETNTEAILRSEWKPKVDSLVVSSTENVEHTAAVCRLAVSQDQSFFVSASHDGTSRVWELRQLEDAVDLQSSLTYSGHFNQSGHPVRVNDVCIVENSHSVASASSNGSVHVWRIEMSSSKSTLSGTEAQLTQTETLGRKSASSSRFYETSRVSGNSLVRDIDPKEGEILAVTHFNTPSASVISFATQMGIHSWDLRCAAEPFALPIRPELGYLTSMAIGNDRNWMVAGTNRGYLALWDIRFRSLVKLWQHSSGAPITRLATCFTTLPQDKGGNNEDKPFIFMGCGLNESAIFDVSTGACRQCFRVLDPALCYIDQTSLPQSCVTIPTLNEVYLPSHSNQRIISTISALPAAIHTRRAPPEPSVQSIMGRIGKRGQSYLITGGSDRFIRYWDFMSVSRCYTVSGLSYGQPRPSYESVDVGPSGQLFLCRQAPVPSSAEIESSKLPKHRHRGASRPDNSHRDAVLDLKNVDFPVKGLLSCSRDGVIKMWR